MKVLCGLLGYGREAKKETDLRGVVRVLDRLLC